MISKRQSYGSVDKQVYDKAGSTRYVYPITILGFKLTERIPHQTGIQHDKPPVVRRNKIGSITIVVRPFSIECTETKTSA